MSTTTKVISERKTYRTARRSPQGQVIRVSPQVYAKLKVKKQRPGESWDAVFRRIFGMPDRKNNPQDLMECWLLPSSGQCFLTRAQARGIAVLNAAARGQKGRIEAPILMRQVI